MPKLTSSPLHSNPRLIQLITCSHLYIYIYIFSLINYYWINQSINQLICIHILATHLQLRASSTSSRIQAVATAPIFTPSTVQGKKTLRKGTVIITGASSGLGLATAKSLSESGKWHIIMACRDFLKAEKAAKSVGMEKQNYTIMHLDLSSLDSVRQFVDSFERSGRPLDVLVCNAAVYQPTAREPSFTADGFELSVGTNHLGHFLLSRLLLDRMKQSDYPSKRLIIVGSITGTTFFIHFRLQFTIQKIIF